MGTCPKPQGGLPSIQAGTQECPPHQAIRGNALVTTCRRPYTLGWGTLQRLRWIDSMENRAWQAGPNARAALAKVRTKDPNHPTNDPHEQEQVNDRDLGLFHTFV